MHNLAAEHSLVSRSSEFEAAIQNGERSSLRLLCDKKSQESEYVSVRWSELVFSFSQSNTKLTNYLKIYDSAGLLEQV